MFRPGCNTLASFGGMRHLPSYRLYLLDGAGKITSADWIAADADDQALSHARDRANSGRFELWERKRLVASHPPQSA